MTNPTTSQGAEELVEGLQKWARIAASESVDGLRPEDTLYWKAASLLLSQQAEIEALKGERDGTADAWQEVVAALYKAWPDAEDMATDLPDGVVGRIEDLIRERDDARADRNAVIDLGARENSKLYAAEARAERAERELAEATRYAALGLAYVLARLGLQHSIGPWSAIGLAAIAWAVGSEQEAAEWRRRLKKALRKSSPAPSSPSERASGQASACTEAPDEPILHQHREGGRG